MNPEHISTIIQRVMEGVKMNNRLCIPCKRWLENEYGTMEPEPWEHCHHDDPEIDYQKPFREAAKIMANWPGDHETLIEPGEKEYPEKQGEDARDAYKRICDEMVNKPPKEPCWCNIGSKADRMKKIYLHHNNSSWDILYCPYCGLKL